MGKWSDIEALYSIVPPLHPLAPLHSLNLSRDRLPCLLLSVKGTGVAMKVKKRVAQKSRFEVKFVRRFCLWEHKWCSIIFIVSSCIQNYCGVLLGSNCHFCGTEEILNGWWGIQQGQEQHARLGTKCNSVQLQRVCWRSMIWMLAPFIPTCLSGRPSMSSSAHSKACIVQSTAFLTWIWLPLV